MIFSCPISYETYQNVGSPSILMTNPWPDLSGASVVHNKALAAGCAEVKIGGPGAHLPNHTKMGRRETGRLDTDAVRSAKQLLTYFELVFSASCANFLRYRTNSLKAEARS